MGFFDKYQSFHYRITRSSSADRQSLIAEKREAYRIKQAQADAVRLAELAKRDTFQLPEFRSVEQPIHPNHDPSNELPETAESTFHIPNIRSNEAFSLKREKIHSMARAYGGKLAVWASVRAMPVSR